MAVMQSSSFAPAPPIGLIVALLVATAGLLLVHWHGLSFMVAEWSKPELSHGYVIPFIAAYLYVRSLGTATPPTRDLPWVGVGLVVLGTVLGGLGRAALSTDVEVYSFIISLVGVSVLGIGWSATLRAWPAFVYLVFMIPIPAVIYIKLSITMQLISSQIGGEILQMVGIPMFREGNVIDLGLMKLQVAEACDGLRYLFPLLSFSFVTAVLVNVRLWARMVIVVSAIPVGIVLNGARIAATGVLLQEFGKEHAEGFLHYFEGWVVFLLCLAVLFAIAALLYRFSGRARRGEQMIDLDLPAARAGLARLAATTTTPHMVVFAMVVVVGVGLLYLSPANARIPERADFTLYPRAHEVWHGVSLEIADETLQVLDADDYLYLRYADMNDTAGIPLNLFVAYYAQQGVPRTHNKAKRKLIHEPEICITGDGWEVLQLGEQELVDLPGHGPQTVRRAVIRKRNVTHLVYYWFQERGRIMQSALAHKFFLVVDAIARNRTDGALVRVDTPIAANETDADADGRLQRFLAENYANVSRHLPD